MFSDRLGPLNDSEVTAPAPVRRWAVWTAILLAAVLVAVGASVLIRPILWPTASDAVRGYLAALARGDARTALGYARTPPADTSWLTDERLRDAMRASPMTSISVPDSPMTEGGAPVGQSYLASYRLGTQLVVVPLAVIQTPQGWKLVQVASVLNLGLPVGLEVQLNGSTVTASSVTVFPGTYTMTSPNTLVDLSSGGSLLVTRPGDSLLLRPVPMLSATGRETVVRAGKQSLTSCLARATVQDRTCPNVMYVRDGEVVDNASVAWSLVGDPWVSAQVTLDVDRPTLAIVRLSPTFHLVARYTAQGQARAVDMDVPTDSVYTVVVTDPTLALEWG